MSDPIQTTRAALSGIKEAVQVGREIKETANEVNAFLDEEAKARVAHLELNDEFYRKRMEFRREVLGILIASAVVYGILKLMGVL